MSSKYAANGAAGQVSSMKNLDVRRLWEKLHTADFRDNCYAYYREASFDKPESNQRIGMRGHPPTAPVRSGKKMGFLKRLAAKSTESRVVLAVGAVMGLGIGITRLLAYSSQSNPVDRVETYMDSLRTDWDKYQTTIKKP